MSDEEDFDCSGSGCWIPDYVWDMYEDGAIEAKDIVVLAFIHMYGGEDGWEESDGSLARLARMSNREWKRRLSLLMSKRLVRLIKREGTLRLKSEWDLIPEDFSEPSYDNRNHTQSRIS